MNFFKSILSDEDPPQPETTTSPSPAPRAGAYTSQTQQTTELPGPRATAPSAWSFGDLVKTITTRSESVLETYRRDLAEFGSGLRKESDLFREVANNAVKDLPSSIDGVMKVIAPEPEPSKNSKSESVRNYSRFDSQLISLQNDVRTYIDDPEGDLGEFGKWKLGFVLDERRGEIAEVLRNEKVEAIYREVVGGGGVNGEVDEASFWCRYFYKVWKMREVEDARSKFVRRAVNVDDEEELSWDVDDDDEEENVVRENVSSSVVDDVDDNERKLSGGDVPDKKIESVLGSGEVKPSGGSVSDEKVELVTKTDENAGVGSVSDKKIESVLGSGEVKPSVNEKVELVTKTDEKAGVGSVSDKEKLQVDEDLEWDEIGDIGENDEKSVLSQGGSLKKDEVLKRLNSGDDDEDLSWDIEDDDEPLNAGKSK